MRKVIVFNSVSIDGYYAGLNNETDWFVHDLEVNKAAHEMMDPDTILFGRTTYQMFENYWPHAAKDPHAPEEIKAMGTELNEMTKIVFSKTVKDVSWENSILLQNKLEEEVQKVKQGNGKDITIFGSGTIVQQLANARLIDEYLLAVTPVLIGKGKSFFHNVKKNKLDLIEARSFHSGMVLLHYRTNND